VVFTARKVRTSQKDAIREIMKNILEKQAKENTLTDFVQKLLFGKIGSEIYKAAKTIAPINKVEMAKLEVIRR
jgi:ribosomal protein S3AE